LILGGKKKGGVYIHIDRKKVKDYREGERQPISRQREETNLCDIVEKRGQPRRKDKE